MRRSSLLSSASAFAFFLIQGLLPYSFLHAAELDLTGHWQQSSRCSSEGGPGFFGTGFSIFQSDPNTGIVSQTQGDDCGSFSFLPGILQRTASCSLDPNVVIGEVSNGQFLMPTSGFSVFTTEFSVPVSLTFPENCGTPPAAGLIVSAQASAVITDDANGIALSMAGCVDVQEVTVINTLGEVCDTSIFGEPSCDCDNQWRRIDIIPGPNQQVEPLPDCTVSFSNVSASGIVTCIPLSDPNGTSPPNFQLLATPLFWNVTTTATVDGTITVCLPYPDDPNDPSDPGGGIVDGTIPPIDENDLQVLHEEGGTWVDRTDSIDPVENVICAVTSSLSEYVLGKSEPFSKDDQKCVNEVNKNVEKVARAQGKDISKCTKDAGKGKLTGAFSECITSDPKGKVLKATGKLTNKVGDKCSEGNPAFPPIDTSDTASMNELAKTKELNLIRLLMGTDLDDAIVIEDPLLDGSKDDAKCQAAIVKQMYKCQSTKLKAFNKCKKFALKEGKDPLPDGAVSALELQNACLGTNSTSETIPGDKIAKDCKTKVDQAIDKKCLDLPTGLFPGCGTSVSKVDLQICVDEAVECEVCKLLNEIDGLSRDCDEFDDGIANGSCP